MTFVSDWKDGVTSPKMKKEHCKSKCEPDEECDGKGNCIKKERPKATFSAKPKEPCPPGQRLYRNQCVDGPLPEECLKTDCKLFGIVRTEGNTIYTECNNLCEPGARCRRGYCFEGETRCPKGECQDLKITKVNDYTIRGECVSRCDTARGGQLFASGAGAAVCKEYNGEDYCWYGPEQCDSRACLDLHRQSIDVTNKTVSFTCETICGPEQRCVRGRCKCKEPCRVERGAKCLTCKEVGLECIDNGKRCGKLKRKREPDPFDDPFFKQPIEVPTPQYTPVRPPTIIIRPIRRPRQKLY